jgi:hypothetical protein
MQIAQAIKHPAPQIPVTSILCRQLYQSIPDTLIVWLT